MICRAWFEQDATIFHGCYSCSSSDTSWEMTCPKVPCAVVSTLRGIPQAELETWLSHHLGTCCFSNAVLFFDDPAELVTSKDALSMWGSQVLSIAVDDELREEYKTCQRFNALQPRLGEDWVARQELHVELAMRRAARDGCEWLLHIDLDELFLLPEGVTAPEHFAEVPPGRNAVAYLNHEGVPELDANCSSRRGAMLTTNRFEETSLFRRNPHCFAEGCGFDELLLGEGDVDGNISQRCGRSTWQRQLDEFAKSFDTGMDWSPCQDAAAESRRCFAFWVHRAKQHLGSAQYFLGYSNGKSAVRVRTGALPNGVHRFGDDDLRRYWNPQHAAVLHFAHGTVSDVIEKLRRLRDSTGMWWQSFPLYARGRDLDDLALKEIYRDMIALEDAAEAQRQEQSGVCFRFHIEKRRQDPQKPTSCLQVKHQELPLPTLECWHQLTSAALVDGWQTGFASDGFFIAKQVLPTTLCDALIARLDAMLAGCFDTGEVPDKVPRVEHQEADVQTNSGKQQVRNNRVRVQQFVNAWKGDSLFNAVVHSQVLSDFVAQVAGWPCGAKVLQDQVWCKPPGSGHLAFHRDTAYMGMGVFTLWLALDDLTPDMGPLEYARGSHFWPAAGTAEIPNLFAKDRRYVLNAAAKKCRSKVDLVPVIVCKGGGSIHNGHTYHGSDANRSERMRRGLGIHYAAKNASPDAPTLFARSMRSGTSKTDGYT